jgi:hypothetical protein
MKFVAVFVVALLSTGFAAEWGYEEGNEGILGPTDWGLVDPVCDGQNQR